MVSNLLGLGLEDSGIKGRFQNLLEDRPYGMHLLLSWWIFKYNPLLLIDSSFCRGDCEDSSFQKSDYLLLSDKSFQLYSYPVFYPDAKRECRLTPEYKKVDLEFSANRESWLNTNKNFVDSDSDPNSKLYLPPFGNTFRGICRDSVLG